MFDYMFEKASQHEVLSCEDASTERRVLVVLCHSEHSYQEIEPFVDRSDEAIRQWFHRKKYFFELDYWALQEVAVNKTKIDAHSQ